MSFKVWQTVKLKDCCTKIGSGATPRGGKEAYLDEGPFSLIRSQNVLDFFFSYNGLAFIDKDQDGFVNTDDCNDIDPTIYPYAQEVACNPVDENCDGVVPYPGGGEMWLGGYGDYTTLIDCDDYTAACGDGNQNGTVKITSYYDGEPVVEYESCSTAHGLIEVVYPPNY